MAKPPPPAPAQVRPIGYLEPCFDHIIWVEYKQYSRKILDLDFPSENPRFQSKKGFKGILGPGGPKMANSGPGPHLGLFGEVQANIWVPDVANFEQKLFVVGYYL